MPAGRRQRPALTGRGLGLGVLVVLLVVVLASPVHRYLASRNDVNGASQQLREHKDELTELRRTKERYGDPGFIQREARQRLQYAMPGDTVYIVVDKGSRTEIEKTRSGPAERRVEGRTWNQRVWNTLRTADK